MLTVTYTYVRILDITIRDEGYIDYTCPDITVVFECNGTKITFSPEDLGKASQWTNLLSAINNNTEYSVWCDGINYKVCYENNIQRLSICSTGTTLDIEMIINDEIKQTLIELEKLAHCIENGVAYEPFSVEFA